MSHQPSLLILPDEQAAAYVTGSIASMPHPNTVAIWFYPDNGSLGWSDAVNLLARCNDVGSEWVFNGLIFLPTAETVQLKGRRRELKNGVFIPPAIREASKDWVLTRIEGLRTYADGDGVICEGGLKLQIFDRKATFTLAEQFEVPAEEVEAKLATVKSEAGTSSEIQIVGSVGSRVYRIEVRMDAREYPVPILRQPLGSEDSGEQTPLDQPAQRRRRKT